MGTQLKDGTPVWVANREASVADPFACQFMISDDGNLVLLDESKTQIWSTNLSFIPSNSTVAVLLDSGNLVLRDASDPDIIFWQSCDHPADTWLPGCYLGLNKATGENRRLTSWKNSRDPTPGFFSLEIESNQFFLKLNNSKNYWSSGNWNGQMFSSAPDFGRFARFEYISNETMNYFTYSLANNETMVVFTVDYSGQITQRILGDDLQNLSKYPASPYQCGMQAFCGPFGSCVEDDLPNCSCPMGFSAASPRDWDSGHRSKGCVPNVPLQCAKTDVFIQTDMTAYDTHHSVAVDSVANCELACLRNCSCTAYSYVNSCSLLYGDLLKLQTRLSSDNSIGDLYLRTGATKSKDSTSNSRGASWYVLGAIIGPIACSIVMFIVIWRCRRRRLMHKLKTVDGTLLPFRYLALKRITNNFSERLGAGSFGAVFKGTLPDSTVVAIKKLEGIRQGEKQFRSEASTIGVIQHVNVVRLYGFCSEGNNKLLVYEYMPNGSLDSHLFRNTSLVLDWKMRYQIALGTARGLSYLHENCRDCIIHCDIKPDNILLDASFIPKVADFGLAKIIDRNFNSVLTTMRGTIGYLAPEWISGGSITAKADVYSYGMMLLEIISGKRNTAQLDKGHYFPVLAANKVLEGDILSLLDPRLEGNANLEELYRACKVAFWCIQDNEDCRISMRQVVQFLEGTVEVSMAPVPKLLQALAENIQSIIYSSDSKTELTEVEAM